MAYLGGRRSALVSILLLLSSPILAQQITYEYDALGRLTIVTTPEGIAQYEYDAVGNILRITTRRYTDVSGPVAILGMSPTKGVVGTTVHLYGRGFGLTPADNQVAFNGTPGSVTAASASSLTVTVPTDATTGPIALTAPLGTAASPEPFTVLQGFVLVPDQADVPLGGKLGFQAILGSASTSAITWRVNGIAGGNASVGTMSATGLYTAPITPPPVQPIPIEALLATDPTQHATAFVRIAAQTSGVEAAAPVSVGPALQPAPMASAPVSVGPALQPAPMASAPVSVTRGPMVSGISPASGPVGASALAVLLTGANLQGATAVRFLQNGSIDTTVAASGFGPSVDGTSLTCSVTISESAPVGPRVLQVVTPQGTSTVFDVGTNAFAVTPQ